jgi:hypothetical protein
MSKFVKIRTELRDRALIKRALEDLKLTYREDALFVHSFSNTREQAALLVNAPGAAFGLRERDGLHELMADDMQMARIKPLLQQVTQRYAYHKVLADAALAGFDLVEETVGKDRVIRLTVRRWSEGG